MRDENISKVFTTVMFLVMVGVLLVYVFDAYQNNKMAREIAIREFGLKQEEGNKIGKDIDNKQFMPKFSKKFNKDFKREEKDFNKDWEKWEKDFDKDWENF